MYHPGHLTLSSVGALTASEQLTVIATLARYGSLVIEQTDPDPGVSCPETLSRIGSLFGAPILHRLSDRFGVHPIRHLENHPEYANTTNADLGMHTDGAFEEFSPQVMLIYCEQPSVIGGYTQVCSCKAIYEHLRQIDPDHIEALSRPDAFFIKRDDRQSSKPVFRAVDGRIQMTYRYGADIMVKFHPTAERGFRAIEEFLANPENYLEFKLRRHQVLVFDNTRILHGRTAFPADAERSLHGLWCDGKGMASAHMKYGFEP